MERIVQKIKTVEKTVKTKEMIFNFRQNHKAQTEQTDA